MDSMLNNYFLYYFSFDTYLFEKEVVTQLLNKHQFTLFDQESRLLLDKTVEGTELAEKVYAYNAKVIALDVEGSGEYPPELVLGMMERKITLDPDFKGFLFFRYPLKISLWQTMDSLFKKNNLYTPLMLLIAPFESVQELEKWITTKSKNLDSEQLYLIDEYNEFTKSWANYTSSQNRFMIINSKGKSNKEVYEEISQIIEESN